jgi:hypothetical protein
MQHELLKGGHCPDTQNVPPRNPGVLCLFHSLLPQTSLSNQAISVSSCRRQPNRRNRWKLCCLPQLKRCTNGVVGNCLFEFCVLLSGAVANGRAKFEANASSGGSGAAGTAIPEKPLRFFQSRSRQGSPMLPVKTPKVPPVTTTTTTTTTTTSEKTTQQGGHSSH